LLVEEVRFIREVLHRLSPPQVITQALEWLTAERKLIESYEVLSNPTEPNDSSKLDTQRVADTICEPQGQLFLFPNMRPPKKPIPTEREEAIRKAVESIEGMDRGKARKE
jgi:hypothetical protein